MYLRTGQLREIRNLVGGEPQEDGDEGDLTTIQGEEDKGTLEAEETDEDSEQEPEEDPEEEKKRQFSPLFFLDHVIA